MNALIQVRSFCKKYQLKKISSEGLTSALRQQGYTIIEFNGIDDNEDVSSLIDALDLFNMTRVSRCFTYRDDKYRLIFINENLTEEERIIALAHEEGHIFGGHMTEDNVFGEDIIQEFNANEFAHYLLKDQTGKIKRRKISIFVVSFVVFILLCLGSYLNKIYDESVYTKELYITGTGSKYHVRDCMYIKDKTNVYRLTKEEFDLGKYAPCEACKPNER